MEKDNDIEVQNILLNGTTPNELDVNKQLSPTLNSSRLSSFRRTRRKFKEKPAKRLVDVKPEPENVTNTLELSEKPFSFRTDLNSIDSLDSLEEIEKNRNLAYKLLLNNKKSDSSFTNKRLTSPVHNDDKTKNSTQPPVNLGNDSSTTTDCDNLWEKISSHQPSPINLPTSSNFQTANGTAIHISREAAEKHSKLLEGVLNSNHCTSRVNKYSFLKKSLTQKQKSVEDLNDPNESEVKITHKDTFTEFNGFNKIDVALAVKVYSTYMKFIKEGVESRKRPLDNCELPVNKKYKTDCSLLTNVNESQDNCDKKSDTQNASSSNILGGFSSASGKKVALNPTVLEKTKNIFDNVELESNLRQNNSKNLVKNKLESFNKFIGNSNTPSSRLIVHTNSSTQKGGFSTASGKGIKLDSEVIGKYKSILESSDMDENIPSTSSINNSKSFKIPQVPKGPDNFSKNSTMQSGGFSTASNKRIKLDSQALGKAKGIIDNTDTDKTVESCNKNNLVKNKLELFNKFIGDEDLSPLKCAPTARGFSSASGQKIQLNPEAIEKQKIILETDLQNPEVAQTAKTQALQKNKLQFFDKFIGDDRDFVPKQPSTTPKNGVLHKKLNYFDKLLVNDNQNYIPKKPYLSTSTSKSIATETSITPIKKLNNSKGSFVKSKCGLRLSPCKQFSISESKLQSAKLLFDEDFAGISPIKTPTRGFNTPKSIPTCSTPVNYPTEVHNSRADTKKKIIFEEKATELRSDSIVTFETPADKTVAEVESEFDDMIARLEEQLKMIKDRRDFMRKLKEEKSESDKKPKRGVLYQSKSHNNKLSLKSFINNTTLGHNAVEDLFCITPQNAADIHFKDSSASITTEDGATVVPNTKNLIGLSEISRAFEAMQGIDVKLLHKDWIKNHYKWIIWKLASYERMLPGVFKGALTVENVVQQLKYRYDREIDKVERSALRRILEKDDAPQKRMVLCVSAIKKLNPIKYNLELTDGWYGIRTIIDEPLCNRIAQGTLRIGAKLVVCNAELVDCDGCHPLDATDLTYLKINYNCTRRAKWDTKLGYQKFPSPILLPIHTINPFGGIIAGIDVCIARVYPLRYLDKTEPKSVWRNEKAEQRKAQQWESYAYERMERIAEGMQKEMEIINNNVHKKDNIRMNNMCMQANIKRDVVSNLKLLLVDLNGSPTRAFNFFLWGPPENVIQMFKEGKCFTIYNILPKKNGDLYASNKTIFKEKPPVDHMSLIFKRKLIPIRELNDLKFSQNFSDFDTVGVVVEVSSDTDYQEIWLCDVSGRLLLIKIYESSSTCSLLDNVKRGQVTSVCNLAYGRFENEVCLAIANHLTIFSSYPRYKHLQEGLDELRSNLPQDLAGVLKECNNKIEIFKQKSFKNKSTVAKQDDEEDALSTSRLTSTDIALSLIDFDQFL
ncbi:unnamed protein product [Phyllotreta striolata]|uniref:Tower domain-containing protein n=1 Tax=Phyllotreta striolata TaxID=444603 RepID=A0A9N9XL39_PHYSR|nr:unnamed protein product [Phyllotreta striolata]